jgi:hypothetical protein
MALACCKVSITMSRVPAQSAAVRSGIGRRANGATLAIPLTEEFSNAALP